MSMNSEKSLLSYPMTIIERGKTWREPEVYSCAGIFSCGKSEESTNGKTV